MLLVGSVTSWCRRCLPWVNSRRAWAERLATVLVLAGALALWWYSGVLIPALQTALWGLLLIALAWALRRGWVQLFGPVLIFDMIRTGRRGRHIVIRAVYALFLLAVLFWIYSAWLLGASEGLSQFPAQALAEFASWFFYVFMAIQFLAVLWLTPAYTAGAIALEKERRTLEFLLSTDLRNREIVLSLFVSRLANLALLVLAGLPVLSILQFMGGVDPNLVLAGFAALGLTMASLAGLGTVNSLYARKPSQAIVRTYVIALAYLALSGSSWLLLAPALNWATFPSTDDWTSPVMLADAVEWLNFGNIGSALMQLIHEVETGGRLDLLLPGVLGKYAWFHGAITVGCCVWTMVWLRSQVLQTGRTSDQENPVRVRTRRSRWGLKQAIRARLHDRAILWKEVFVGGRSGLRPLRSLWVGVILAVVFLPVVYLFYFFGRVFSSGPEDGLGSLLNFWVRAASGFLGSILLLGVAVRSASSLSRERDQQTLDGLLATPLDNRTILLEKWLASLLGERRVWLVLGLVWVIGYCTGGLHPLAIPGFLVAWLGYALFLSAMGLWFSVANRSSHRAIFGTLLTTALGLGALLLAAYDIPSTWLPDWLARNWEYLFLPPVTLGVLIFSPQNYQHWLSGQLKLEYYPLLLGLELLIWFLVSLGVFGLANIRFRVVTGRTSGLPNPPCSFPAKPITTNNEEMEEEWEYIIPRSRRPKRLLARTLLVLPLLLMLGWYGLRYLVGERDLQMAIAEADRLDPGWRLEELEAKREIIPDEENSGLLVIKVREGLPKDYWDNQETWRLLEDLPPENQLNEPQIRVLAATLKSASSLILARRMSNLPRGRYPVDWRPDGISTLLPYVQNARAVANVLWFDSLLRAQEDDADRALDSCRAIVNTGRSIGDEPTLVSMLVRMTIELVAVQSIERTLAQTQPTEPALERFQRLLVDEEAQPLLLIGTRGERAIFDQLLDSLQAGKTSLPTMQGSFGVSDVEIFLIGSLKGQRAALLQIMTEYVEAAKLPEEKQLVEFQKIESSISNRSLVLRRIVPATGRVVPSFLRNKSLLRSAIVAVAVERYRLRHGQWPESLTDLPPDLLAKIPNDPYLGKPLRYRRLADGVVIYSVGPDGIDDGGKIDRKDYMKSGTDIGIRLWDPDKRRQQPLPPKKAEDETESSEEKPKSP